MSTPPSPPAAGGVVVAGGGISGLAAAFELCGIASRERFPLRVTLLEASERPGGSLSTLRRDGFLLEEGADSFVRTKPAAQELCGRLGLAGSLIPTRPGPARTLVVRRGRLLPIPEGMQFFVPTSFRPMITTPVLSWPGKMRMALDLLLPRGRAALTGGDESIGAFVRRRLGREALERLAQPLVAGVWSGDPDSLSLRATLPQLLDMEAKHRSLILAFRARIREGRESARAAGARYGLFLSLRGGVQQLVDALAAALPPGTLRAGCALEGLSFDGGRWRLATSAGPLEADAVILALPAPRASRLLRGAEPRLAERIALPASAPATLNLVYRSGDLPRPLEGYGFVCPEVEERSMLACTFSSRKYEGRSDDGHAILRAYVGGARGAAARLEDDAELLAEVRRDLAALLGITAPPLFHHLRRYEPVMPTYLPGHLDRVEEIERLASGLPGLALAGNYLRGVGISDCIESARRAAEGTIARLRAATPAPSGPAGPQ